jgi:hypothetical protein
MAKKKQTAKWLDDSRKPPLGSGERFAALEKQVDGENPAAIAAAIGRKKYGKARMQKMAQAGRKRRRG